MTSQMKSMAPTVIQDEDDETWEHQQIRKAMGQTQASSLQPLHAADDDHQQSAEAMNFRPPSGDQIKAPVAYNLQGIKGRIKERYNI